MVCGWPHDDGWVRCLCDILALAWCEMLRGERVSEGTKFNLDLRKCIRFLLPQFVIMILKSKRKFNFISFETFKIPKSNPVYWRSLGNFKEKPFKCQISLKFWNYDKIPQMKQAAPLTIHLISLFVCKINVFLISHDWDLSPPPLCCVYSVNYFLRVY